MIHSFHAEEAVPQEGALREFFDQALTFLYTIAHWAGELISQLVELIVGYALPTDLIDPLGFLILLTLFLAVAEVAKRIAWLVVVVGWALIVVRIVIEVLSS
jgi:hypothetical protein